MFSTLIYILAIVNTAKIRARLYKKLRSQIKLTKCNIYRYYKQYKYMFLRDIFIYNIYNIISYFNYIFKYPQHINILNGNNKFNLFKYITPDHNDIAGLSLSLEYQVPLDWINEDTSWRTASTEHDSLETLCHKIYSQQHDYQNHQAKVDFFDHMVEIPHCSILKLNLPALQLINAGNAGGNSILSEAYSIELLNRYYDADNFIFENDIQYWHSTCSIIDYITYINNQRVGVSVTRALNYQNPTDFTLHQATKLLQNKLYGLLIARNAVVAEQRYLHSILHIWVQNQKVCDIINHARQQIDIYTLGPNVYGNVIILVSICDNNSLYENQHVMLKYLLNNSN